MAAIKWLFTMQRNNKGSVQPPPIVWVLLCVVNLANLYKIWREIQVLDRPCQDH